LNKTYLRNKLFVHRVFPASSSRIEASSLKPGTTSHSHWWHLKRRSGSRTEHIGEWIIGGIGGKMRAGT